MKASGNTYKSNAALSIKIALVIVWVALGSACTSINSALGGNTQTEAKAEVSWEFGAEAIMLEVSSDAALNSYQNQARTLVLGVFQMSDPKAFLSLIQDPDQVKRILASGQAGAEFLHLDRYVISPDGQAVLKADRAQDAMYVGVIAGYHQLAAATSARLFRIPLNIQTSGMISTSYQAEPATLALRLQLGRERITAATSLSFDADKKPRTGMINLDNQNLEVDTSPNAQENSRQSSATAKKL